MFHPADIPSAKLHVPHIVTTEWQTVGKLVGYKFSFRKWLRNIGREYDNDGAYTWEFGLRLGYYEVYTDWTIPAKTEFRMLEMAIINTDWTAMVSQTEFKSADKIRLQLWQPRFKYEEIRE